MRSADYRKCAKCREGRMRLDRTVLGIRIYKCSECEVEAEGEVSGDFERLRYSQRVVEGRGMVFMLDEED